MTTQPDRVIGTRRRRAPRSTFLPEEQLEAVSAELLESLRGL